MCNRLKLVQNQTDDINEQDMPSPLSTKSENTLKRRVAESPIVHKEVEATNMVPLRRWYGMVILYLMTLAPTAIC